MMQAASPVDYETAAGKLVNILYPDADLITVFDVATSLAAQTRYNGNLKPFPGGGLIHYSVAQHSIHVADLLAPEDRIHGLLHDAAEMPLGDLTRPVQNALCRLIPTFKHAWHDLHGRNEASIYDALKVRLPTPEQRERVKRADDIVLATEARDVVRTSNNWNLPEPPTNAFHITPLDADSSRILWLDAVAKEGVEVWA